jgi:hypothetical protein
MVEEKESTATDKIAVDKMACLQHEIVPYIFPWVNQKIQDYSVSERFCVL